jgi:acetyl esterase/lipase
MYDYLAPRPNHEMTVNPLVLYLESPDFATHPYVSPIYADHFDHLPPILIQSGGCESLRDEIVALENKISKSKTTKVRHEVYKVCSLVYIFSILNLFRI